MWNSFASSTSSLETSWRFHRWPGVYFFSKQELLLRSSQRRLVLPELLHLEATKVGRRHLLMQTQGISHCDAQESIYPRRILGRILLTFREGFWIASGSCCSQPVLLLRVLVAVPVIAAVSVIAAERS
jgi:hypothetical protein